LLKYQATERIVSKLVNAIRDYNAGRDPERLAMKYRNMRGGSFVFLRATCHLFASQLPDLALANASPLVWSCGDLHLENFGSYRGDNDLVYFDINDFDESALMPANWDLLRLLTSLRLASGELGHDKSRTRQLIDELLAAYFAELRRGSARWIERETALGPIRKLLEDVRTQGRKAFVASRTYRRGKALKIEIDGKRALAASSKQHEAVEACIRRYAKTTPEPKFYEVLDVARRIAGNGGLGVDRFVVLVRGKGEDGERLLDLKQAIPSALRPDRIAAQPSWPDEAQRIAAIAQRALAVPPALLHAVTMKRRPYLLRELQPAADRVSYAALAPQGDEIVQFVRSLGQCTAWSHLRGSGRQGAAIADELITFAGDASRARTLRKASKVCANTVVAQWKAYAEAYDAGAFSID